MKKILLSSCIVLLATSLSAQVGIGTATPDASAQLDITATGKGLLIPRMKEADRPLSPAKGLLIYQDDVAPGFYYYDGAAWKPVDGSSNSWSLNGNAGTGATNFIGTTNNQPLVFKVAGEPAGFLSSDNSKSISFGYQADKNNTGAWNTSFGFRALNSNTNGFANTAFGYQSLYMNTSGSYNTALGHEALSSNLTGYNNIALGRQALQSNTSGYNNIAHGYNALIRNKTGSSNLAIGNSALYNNDDGSDNIAIGPEAMYSCGFSTYQNVAIGAQSLGTVSSNTNTAIGYHALSVLTTGYNNVGIGAYTMTVNKTGNNNTVIGYNSNVADGADNATAIGSQAFADASNKVRIGNSAVTAIEGAANFVKVSDGRFKFNVTENVKGLPFILKLRPVTYQFDGKGLDDFSKPEQAKFASYDAGIEKAYRDAALIRRTGLIAQEVEKAANETGYDFDGIHKPQTEKDHYSLSYSTFIVPLIKAVQEQQQTLEQLKNDNQTLKTENTQLRKEIENILQKEKTITAHLEQIEASLKK